jgi:hypothetical protein
MLETLAGDSGGPAARLPSGMADWAGEIIEQVRANPGLARILLVIGVITAVIFVLGIVKHAFRSAFIGGALCVAAWIWYFNIR